MKLRYFRVLLVLSLCYVLGSSIAARDLNSWNSYKDSAYQQQNEAATSSADLINWPTFYGVQQTGEITAAFSSFGTFGLNYNRSPLLPVWPPYSFSTPENSGVEYLYGGAVWIGGIVGEDTLVSVGFDGWQFVYEFNPTNYADPSSNGTVTKLNTIADFSMRAEFSDTSDLSNLPFDPNDGYHRPMNLKIANRSYAWHSWPQNKAIIYDMVITNVGDEPIHDGYVGFYFDCDVGADFNTGYFDDLTGSFRNKGIGYIIDNNGDLDGSSTPAEKIFAFRFLSNSFEAKDTSYNWWIGNVDGSLDFGPRQRGTSENPFRDFGTGGIGTPEGDANKYYVMRFREWDYDQIQTYSISNNDPVWLTPNPATDGDFSDGYDTRFLMSLGLFDLPVDASIRVLYSTFTGDFVHTTGASINYLPHDPLTYFSLLYFDDVFANAIRTDSLAELLLDPNLPPLGLQVIKKPDNSHELQWDPWVYDDVFGYHVFISEANLDTLPYPGSVPPWWQTDAYEIPAVIGKTYKLGIDSLDPDKYYIASVTHDLGSGIGELSVPIQFKFNPRESAPTIPSRHAFANPGGPLTLKWNLPPDKSGIDHFNIYKFPNKTSALKAYHARYDEGYFAQFFPPKDSFEVDDKKYFFYAMEPYAVAGADDTVFFDPDVTEGQAYIIASADQYGFESEFTEPIMANVVDEMTRDVLLITNSQVVTPNNFTFIDSVYSFYNRILHGYDYEIYNHRDSTNIANCPSQNVKCMDWHDFMKFKMVIVDDHYSEAFFSNQYQDSTDGFVRYLGYGGKLSYFGRFRGFGFNNPNGTLLNYVSVNHDFINTYLGIDSLMFGGERYYHNFTSPPYFDTLFGFIKGIQADGLLPSLEVDTLRDPFTPRLRTHWEHKTPPGVATFKINSGANTSLLFNSVYPLKSLQQNHVVGVRRDFPDLNTYAHTFGFHLWYMDSTDARDLIESIFNDSPSALAAQTHIEPSQFHVIAINALVPRFAFISIGDLTLGRTVNDINTSSLLINNVVLPVSTEIIPSYPGFNGEVLKIEIPVRDLLITYGVVWNTLFSSYEVNGILNDNLLFKATGSLSIIGHRRGDVNGDETVNVLDLTIIVDYLFRGQSLPDSNGAADVDGNGSVNILDLTRLVDHIFRGGDL